MVRRRRWSSQESYYEHSCSIVSERDVLDTEIKGDGWASVCKRKWYDLFLLSNSDVRAGEFYYSTHAMKLNRRNHYYRHRNCIHPLSKFRHYWDAFMLHAFILYKIQVFCMTSLISCSLPVVVYYLAMLMEVFMILDIYLNARTGYIDHENRRVVLERDLALAHYCSTKLFFHSISAIPLVFITFLRYGNQVNCVICKANYFICTINFLTVISTFRVYELSFYWIRGPMTSIKSPFYKFLQVGVIITMIAIQFVHYSDTISVMNMMNRPFNESKHFSNSDFFHIMFVTKFSSVNNKTDSYYMNAQFWRVVSFLARPTYGAAWEESDFKFSTVYPHPLIKVLKYTLVSVCCCWLLVEMYFFATRDIYYNTELQMKRNYVMNLVKTLQLPEQSSLKMKQYFELDAAKVKLIEQKHGLYRALPQVLKDEISWHCHQNIIRIPYFSNWPREVVEKIVALVNEQIYLKNDMIAEAGVQGEGLMMVEAGTLAVYSAQHEELGHLIDGDYFGELSLVTDREVRTSSVVAASSCTVLLLEKYQFRMIMRDHPQLFYSLKEALTREYQTKREPSSMEY